jgi:hypothetical protein
MRFMGASSQELAVDRIRLPTAMVGPRSPVFKFGPAPVARRT